MIIIIIDIRLPLSFSQHDTRNVRTWMAHEMIEEGKLLKMIYSVLHDSLLATSTGNSETSSDNSTTISRTTTDTVDTTSSATTTGDQKQSKRSSESQLQGAIKRQRTYEPEAGEEEKNVRAAAEFWAVMRTTHKVTRGPQVPATAANGSKVNPGSPMGQPWVPDFWGATVGSRTKIVNRGSPRPVFSFACAGQPDQIVNL
jgi:hypothetical protein